MTSAETSWPGRRVDLSAPGQGRRFGRRLLALCALALALRLGAVALVPTQPVSDYWSYLRRAENLLDSGTYGVRPGRPDATWPPGYPLALAGVLAISGRSLLAAKVWNVLLGVALVALTGLAGRRLGGERAGIAAAAVAALLPRLVLLPCLLASENLFEPLLLLWVLIVAGTFSGSGAGSRENPGLLRALVGGLVVGVASLARIVGYLLGLIWPLAGLLARRPMRRVAAETLLVLAAQHAVMLPWALRNRETLGSFSFLTSAGGATLYIGNSPQASGRWRRVAGELGPGGGRRTSPGDDFERDRRFRQEAVRFMREHPGEASALYGRKLVLLFAGEGIVEQLATAEQVLPRHALPRGSPPVKVEALPPDHPLRRDPRRLGWPVAAGYWLLLALEIAGCAILLRRAFGRGDPERWRWRAAAGAFLGAALYLIALAALFHGDPRFRWPASDVLIPVAGLAVAAVGGGGRAARAPSSAVP